MVRTLLIGSLVLFGSAGALQADSKVVVILDDSGSMLDQFRANRRLTKIDVAKTALLTVLEQLPADAQVGVICLNSASERDGWLIPLGPVDEQQVRQRVGAIQANGGTPLGRFLKVGGDALLEQRARNPYGTFRLLVVTDGEATDAELVERFLPDIRMRGLEVDVIGVDMQQDHSLATRVNRYRRADDRESLVQAMQESLAESAPVSDDASAESDFALLEALPEGIAIAAIQAYSERDDRPIEASMMQDEQAASPPMYHPSSPAAPPSQPPVGRRSRGLSIALVFVVFVVLSLLNAMIRSARRR